MSSSKWGWFGNIIKMKIWHHSLTSHQLTTCFFSHLYLTPFSLEHAINLRSNAPLFNVGNGKTNKCEMVCLHVFSGSKTSLWTMDLVISREGNPLQEWFCRLFTHIFKTLRNGFKGIRQTKYRTVIHPVLSFQQKSSLSSPANHYILNQLLTCQILSFLICRVDILLDIHLEMWELNLTLHGKKSTSQ